MEYLQLFYKLGRAGGVLERFGAVDFATTIAPGVRDVLLIGKVYEAARRARDKSKGSRSAPVYDAVVLDAPPTGRIVRFLGVNQEVAGLARVGPIRSQADSITALLRSPACAVHIVTLLEEMPVQETIDAVAELRAARLRVGGIVVNQVRDPEVASIAAGGGYTAEDLTRDLAAAGVRTSKALVSGLLQEADDLADRAALEEQEGARVDALDRPTYRLPLLPDGVEGSGVRELAAELTEQGMA